MTTIVETEQVTVTKSSEEKPRRNQLRKSKNGSSLTNVLGGSTRRLTTRVSASRPVANQHHPKHHHHHHHHHGKQKPQDSANELVVRKEHAVEDLTAGTNDLAIRSLVLKDLAIDADTAGAFYSLLRGDGRSWAGMSVDMWWQHTQARWISVKIDSCSEEYLDTCVAILFTLDNVHTIELSGIFLTSHATSSLIALGFNNCLKNLRLDLLDLGHAVPTLTKALQRNKCLQSISFSRCGLNDSQVAQLIESLQFHPEILELKLFGNKCRARGLEAITKLLENEKTKIQILDLSYQHVGDEDEFDISWLCEALAENKSLKVLDLDNDSVDDGHLSHLALALTQNTTLEELMLNHNKITQDGVTLLASKFSEMKGLKKISMYSNLFGGK